MFSSPITCCFSSSNSHCYHPGLCRLLWHVRSALKDRWAFNLSLLAVRSSLIHSPAHCNSLPLHVKNRRLISRHRDAAAVDFLERYPHTALQVFPAPPSKKPSSTTTSTRM